MITRFTTLSSRLAAMLAFLFTLAACGGGGGGGFNPDSDANTQTWHLKLELLDSDGNPTNSVSTGKPITLKVTVTRNGPNGAPVPDALVNAVSDIGLIFPPNGNALTDSNGVAALGVEAGVQKGAGTITVTAPDAPSGAVTETINFQVNIIPIRLGSFQDGVFIEGEIDIQPEGKILSPSGVGTLTVAVVDENDNRVATPEIMTVSSECLVAGLAALDPESPVTVTGQITMSYTVAGCSGDDEVTASVAGSSSAAMGTFMIAPKTANAISFTSATPPQIVLKGTGGGTNRQESSTVLFTVVDADNNPISGIEVDFDLSTDVGGLSIGNTTDISGLDGTVETTVFSGNVSTVVRVIATITSSDISTVSDVLVVTTGLPDQNSMDLSVEGGFIVPNAYTTSGSTKTITVRMADKYNNPVPEGTSAIFTTEYGSIDGSCILGVSNGDRLGGAPPQGECSVQWLNQAPKTPSFGTSEIKTIEDDDYSCPSHNGSSGPCPDDLGGIRGGRSTILVTSVGEETFDDKNGNGLYDRGERFNNLPEAFHDHNEDLVYTPVVGPNCPNPPTSAADCRIAGSEETFVDFNKDLTYNLNDDPALYNGILCPPEGDGDFCSRELVNVRAQTVLILSSGEGFGWDIIVVTPSGGVIGNSNSLRSGETYEVYVSDLFNNPPPGGSTVEISAAADCQLSETFEIADTPVRGAFATGAINPTGEGTNNGSITITLKPAEGNAYTETWPCIPQVPPPDPEDGDGGDGDGLGFGS
jgi:hypothetical protein